MATIKARQPEHNFAKGSRTHLHIGEFVNVSVCDSTLPPRATPRQTWARNHCLSLPKPPSCHHEPAVDADAAAPFAIAAAPVPPCGLHCLAWRQARSWQVTTRSSLLKGGRAGMQLLLVGRRKGKKKNSKGKTAKAKQQRQLAVLGATHRVSRPV